MIFCAVGTAVVFCAIFGCHSPEAARLKLLPRKPTIAFQNPSTPKPIDIPESQRTKFAASQQQSPNSPRKAENHITADAPKQPIQSENAITSPKNLAVQNQPIPILPDDPPEIAEFAKTIEPSEHHSYSQKLEMLELLRKESPEMRFYMIANFMAMILDSAKNSTKKKQQNHILPVSHQTPADGKQVELHPIRQAAFDNGTGEDDENHEVKAQNNESIRLVQSNSSRSNIASFRNRVPSELASPPRIVANPALPSVLAADGVSEEESEEARNETEFTEYYEEDEQKSSNTPGSVKETGKRIPSITDQETEPYLNFPGEPEKESGKETSSGFLPIGDGDSQKRTQIGFTNLRGTSLRQPENQTAVPSREENASEQGYAVSSGMDMDTLSPSPSSAERENFFQTPSQTPSSFRTESPNESMVRAVNTLNARLQLYGDSRPKEQISEEIHQRLLNLMLGQQREAIKPIHSLPSELQEFWRNELLGLSTMLDETSIPDQSHRYAVAQHHLQTAGLYLQNLCPIRIKNMNFINECDGFGVYKIAKNEFRRGDPMFIYAEIDNLASRENETVYQTKVRSHYELVDTLGNNLASGDFGDVGKETQSRIRDAFLLMRVDLPETLMPGKYFLKVTIADLNHPELQFDQQRLDLNVVTQ
ncbi:MAG: hypothetical protein LBJ67_15110 [Planctomycetaceae bacterium]|nr:hypothetical protein [Planctomycetaceae bacterium]